MITMTAGAVARALGGSLRGAADLMLSRAGAIDDADATTLTFVRDAAYARAFLASPSPAAIVSRAIDLPDPLPAGKAAIVVDDADLAMLRLLEIVSTRVNPPPAPGVHPTAVVHSAADIDASVSVGPGCVIGAHASIGHATVLHANVFVAPGCRIGSHCILHPGVVIGAEGFGYRPDPDRGGLPIRIPHVGAVRVGDRVEIGANTTIDRGKFTDTLIGDDTKIDNLVQIGHNCRIGRGCLICGQAGLSGSVVLGDGVVLGGQAGIADNLKIGDKAMVGAQAGVMFDAPAGVTVAGSPAVPRRQYAEQIISLGRATKLFADLRRRLDALERQRPQDDRA